MLEFQLLINTKRYEFESSHQQRNEISKTVSEDKITPVKPLSNSQQYNPYSDQEKGLQQPNFITLSKIPEEEQIEIIQKGFQLKGYSINYERIRCTNFYQ